MSKHLPNTLTILNLVCGFLSIHFAMSGHYLVAGYFIFAAGLFDFSDGLAARLLNAYSDLGKQLDSLADMVSFGVAPAVLYSALIGLNVHTASGEAGGLNPAVSALVIYSPVLIVIATALRLARFNIDKNQNDFFRGLPSPASGLFFASLVFIPDLLNRTPPLVFAVASAFMGFLMISRLPLLSIKITSTRDPKFLFILFFSLFSILVVVLFSVKYIGALIILYIFIAAVVPQFTKRH
jgi:CDP-diacylglycerol--serine O-phosphatidyltransferase